MTRKRKKNVDVETSVTGQYRMSGIATEGTLMTETGTIDTGTTTMMDMSVTTGNTPPVTTDEGRSSKATTTTGLDRVTRTKNASRNGTLERRITGSRLESTNWRQTRAHQQIKAKHLTGGY